MATILAGDLNVHHRRWLAHSNSVSVEGTALFRFCCARALKQHVRSPTREDYLLDLVIPDIIIRNVGVLQCISNHNMVLAVFDIGISEMFVVKRVVYDYAEALLSEIQAEFVNADWSSIETLDVDNADRFFDHSVFARLNRHIPRREISERKFAHLSINERCVVSYCKEKRCCGHFGFHNQGR